MKRIIHAILALIVVGAFSWAIWRGLSVRRVDSETEPDEPAMEHHAEAEALEYYVSLEEEKWKAIGIELAEPEGMELRRRREAYGRVLDPVALVGIDGELAAAEAAIVASRAEFERTQKLLAGGENTSRRVFESAEAQFRADEIKLAALRDRAVLQWGQVIPIEDPEKRHAFVDALVKRQAALVRVDLLPGDAVAELPEMAELLVLGHEQQLIHSARVSLASDVDPRTQARGFIIVVENPEFPLLPGRALTAWLEFPGKARAGYVIPRAAVLRHDGRTWVYVQVEPDKFARKAIVLESPLERGWFVAGEDGGLELKDRVVVVGSQILLSEEMKAAAGSSEEE